MLRKLFSNFRKNTLMDRAYKRSYEMLDLTREMYKKSREALRSMEDVKIDINIRNKDREVNKYEREVRRDVFKHLAVGDVSDLSSGFALVSIIIDIERIGDFTKNMVELALEHPGKLRGGAFEEDLTKIENAVDDEFKRTRSCFELCQEDEGRKILKEFFWINKTCDRLFYNLVREEDKNIPAGDAAALALYIRWMKRINSHLRNITTSVVNPFDRIGFEEKKEKS